MEIPERENDGKLISNLVTSIWLQEILFSLHIVSHAFFLSFIVVFSGRESVEHAYSLLPNPNHIRSVFDFLLQTLSSALMLSSRKNLTEALRHVIASTYSNHWK